MQEQPIVVEYRKVDVYATLLLRELITYMKKSFAKEFDYINSVDEDSIHAVLQKLSTEPAVIEALDQNKGFLGNAWDTVKSLNPKRLVVSDTPYHRVSHLLYFADKAKQLQTFTSELLAFTQSNSETNETTLSAKSESLIKLLQELFTTAEFLRANDYSKLIDVQITDGPYKLAGMKGAWGGSELAKAIATIFGNDSAQKLSQLTQDVKQKAVASLSLKQQRAEQNKAREDTLLEAATKLAVTKISAVTAASDRTVGELRLEAEKLEREKAEKEHANEKLRREAEELARRNAEQKEATNTLISRTEVVVDQLASSRHYMFALHKPDADGYNSLHQSIKENKKSIVAVALDAGVDANIPTGDERSPLSLALLDKNGNLKDPIKPETVEIVELLLQHGANPNECSPEDKGNRSFVHLLLFNKARNVAGYKLKESPNRKLIELFFVHGCSLGAGDSEAITSLASNDADQSQVAKLLRTVKFYSVGSLRDLIESQFELVTQYAALKSRNLRSLSAQSELSSGVIDRLYDRYHLVFEFFLTPREESRKHITGIIEKIGKEQMNSDLDALQKIMEVMDQKIKDLRLQKINVEPIEDQELTFSNIKAITFNLMKCILKVQKMHTVRYQDDPAQTLALTPLEARLIHINLDEAKEEFKKDQEANMKGKRKEQEKQAALAAGPKKITMSSGSSGE
jgi:hypothetical protein